MPQAIMRDPTPAWLKPGAESVTDSNTTKALRALAKLIGANDPTSQVMGVMASGTPAGEGGVLGMVKKAIKAYHGSPHDFDTFDVSKIGTGEGAQAYGHGLYFAENPGVAKSYRDQLSGVSVQPNVSIDAQAAERLGFKSGDGFGTVEQYIRNATRESKGDLAKAASNLRNGAQSQLSGAEHFDAAYQARARQFADQANMAADMIEKGAVSVADNPGRMYEVNIHADPEDFLDWDKPLSQQSEKVRNAGASVFNDPRRVQAGFAGGFDPNAITGADLVHASEATWRGGKRGATEALNQAGIPGIKYLDGNSRSFAPPTIKDGPNGAEVYWGNDPRPVGTFPTRQEAETVAKQFDTRSRNYVVFDDALVEILKKWGLMPGAVAGGYASQQQQEKQ